MSRYLYCSIPYAKSDEQIYFPCRLIEQYDDGEAHLLGEWRATSGLCGWQDIDNVWTRNKGTIPPSDQIAKEYWVDTVPQVKMNLGGLAFFIHPLKIFRKGDTRDWRSEIFIHSDINSEGSEGCINPPPDEWKSFYPTFHNLYLDHKIERVKLIVKAV